MLFRDFDEEFEDEFPDLAQQHRQEREDYKMLVQQQKEKKELILEKDAEENVSFLAEGGLEEQENEKVIPRPRIDYKFMDGLRGFGAFAVYIQHFMCNFYAPEEEEDVKEGRYVAKPPVWVRYPPTVVTYHGAYWVMVFFILSGFVLPNNYFKTGRISCIYGGVMRRYFRLMLPVLMILSIYHICARMDLFGESTYNKIKNKTWLDLMYAGLLETWYPGTSMAYIEPTWTLSVEFMATFFIYLVAFTAHAYRGRFFFYSAILCFFWVMDILGYLNLVPYHVPKIIKQIPYFILGVIISDMENMVKRPLDKIRDLHWGWKIPLNGFLMLLILLWGSKIQDGTGSCLTAYDEVCDVYQWMSLWGFLPNKLTLTISSLAAIILALTSDVAQWILGSPPMQFLGQISYTIYLFHQLVNTWMMRDTYNYLLGEGWEPEQSCTIIFVIYTPFLLLVSWILEIIIDRPSKEFAGEFDRQIRRQQPNPMPVMNEATGLMERPDKKEFYSCSSFSKRIWPIWAFIGWLLFVLVSTEAFAANHTYKPQHPMAHEKVEHEEQATKQMFLL